jgi:hypothetical protein
MKTNKQIKADVMKQVETMLAKSKQAPFNYNEKAVEIPGAWAHNCPYGLDRESIDTLKEWGVI